MINNPGQDLVFVTIDTSDGNALSTYSTTNYYSTTNSRLKLSSDGRYIFMSVEESSTTYKICGWDVSADQLYCFDNDGATQIEALLPLGGAKVFGIFLYSDHIEMMSIDADLNSGGI